MIEDPTLLSLLSELSEGDGDDTIGDITRALDKIDALTDPLLASLMCSKEGISKLKDRIVVEDPELRCILISRLGKNIVRTWITVCSESFDIEGYVRVENRSEARRFVEDFLDAATDIMKSFAQGALGRAPASVASQILPDNVHCCSAYCEVLTYLCDAYNAAFEPLDSWTDALAGVSGSGSLAIHTASGVALKSSALSLLPLLKAACAVAFKDRYQLINRCRELPSYSYAPLRFVSAFMRTLLLDLSPTASLLTVLDSSEMESSGQSLFGLDATDASLSGHLPVVVVEYVTTWVNTFLVSILTRGSSSAGCVVEEVSSVLRDVICITQHSALVKLRAQVSDVVLQKLFFLIENYASLTATSTTANVPCNTLVAWAVLMLRYITPTTTTNTTNTANTTNTNNATTSTDTSTDSVSYPYYTRVFKLVCDIVDPVTQTRFFAEYSTLLLHHTIHHDTCKLSAMEEWDKHSASRSGYKYTTLLPNVLLRSNLVRLLVDMGVRTAGSAVLARFTTALCTAYTTLLQYALTPVLVLAPVVLELSSVNKVEKVEKVEKELDVFSFTPTVDSFVPTTDTSISTTKTNTNTSTTSVEYVALLASYLQGGGETHPWDLTHTLCTTRIHTICTTIHTLLHPVPDSVVSVYSKDSKDASVVERVRYEYSQLVGVLVKLIEGAVFALKTFEGCLKWPLGDGTTTVHTLYKASSAQTSYTALVSLLSKLLHTSDYALFGTTARRKSSVSDDLFGTSVGSSGSVGGGSSGVNSNRENTTTLLANLAPYTTPYTDTINKLRTELVYILHLALEHVSSDVNKLPRASFVYTFLHTMIVHRVVLPNTNTTSTISPSNPTGTGVNNGGDLLGSGELILKHIRAMMYHNNMHDEYLLTLQAKSMQGTLGGAQALRFDGPLGGLTTQLQALELLVLHIRQLSKSSSGGGSNSQLQHAVSLLRTVERDYLWSEAVELVQATGSGSGSVDSLHTPTFTTSSGVVVSKLPVSPVLRDHIQVCIESVLPLLCTTASTSGTNTNTSTKSIPKWADKLYNIADIHAYITTSTNTGYNILAINNVTQFSDYVPPASTCSALLDGTTPRTRSNTITNATNTTNTNTVTSGASTDTTSGTYSACDSVLALLQHFRVNGSALLHDTADHILARGLFSGHSPATSTSTTTSALPAYAYVTSADVVAQVTDVLHAHLYSGGSGSDGMLSSNLDVLLPLDGSTDSTTTLSPEAQHTYLYTALLPPREKHWTVVSGSADLLTVLAYSSIDVYTSTAYIHVRVFNSAGFKIPTFAVHVVINGNLLCVSSENYNHSVGTSASTGHKFSPLTTSTIQQSHTTTTTVPSQSVVFDRDSVSTADGVEFFLPDAYIERTFSCKVVQFAPFQMIVRVVYADLVYDEDDIYEIPDTTTSTTNNTSTGANSRLSRTNSVSKSALSGNLGITSSANNKNSANAKAKKNATAAANASTRGARYMDEYKTQGHSNKWTAVLDCAPLHVPVTALLLPYGYGTYTAMQYWARDVVGSARGSARGSGTSGGERAEPGIAHEVFVAQWNRLGGRFECSLPVDGELVLEGGSIGSNSKSGAGPAYLSALVTSQLRSAVRRAITTYGGTGMHLLGTDGMVQCGSGVSGAGGSSGSSGSGGGMGAYGVSGEEWGTEDHVFAPYAAWSLQTPQGAEVSIRLTIDSPVNFSSGGDNSSGSGGVGSISSGLGGLSIGASGSGSGISAISSLSALIDTNSSGSNIVSSDGCDVHVWTGRVTVRCSDHHTLQAVCYDAEYLVYALSGGYVALSEHDNV